MKTLAVIFSILILGLSGCAHPGYQRGYVGYSTGYSSGYGGQSYYDYPVRSYYQPGGVIRYQQQYLSPRYPHRYDGHDDWRGKDRDWSNSAHRYEKSRQYMEHGDQNRWGGGRADAPHGRWEAEAKKRQFNSESRGDWQSGRESRGSLGRLKHRSGPELSIGDQGRHGFGRHHD